jgi:hypothetical protein
MFSVMTTFIVAEGKVKVARVPRYIMIRAGIMATFSPLTVTKLDWQYTHGKARKVKRRFYCNGYYTGSTLYSERDIW